MSDECMHRGCWRKAVRTVGYEKPDHAEFKGQTHDCCNFHSRPAEWEKESALVSDEPCIHDMEPGTCTLCKPPIEDASRIYCIDLGCTESVANHRWGQIKADGWFFKKNGDAWCSKHIPDWVKEWRSKR